MLSQLTHLSHLNFLSHLIQLNCEIQPTLVTGVLTLVVWVRSSLSVLPAAGQEWPLSPPLGQ